ncbi:MAG TPA: SDR family oxidoreductase [bacterium]|nr:SDR family oxidoreductase [bacterium]
MAVQGETIAVFGGGRGLGRAVALAGARAGARIVVAARTRADVEAVAAEARALGAEAQAVAADARRSADVEAVLAAADRWGPAGIVVSTVGESLVKPFEQCTLDDWHRVIEGNLTPAFLIAQAAMPRLIARRGGRLVLVSSRVAVNGGAIAAIYGAAKAGVVGLARSLALLGKPYGVAVHAICPAPMDTPMRWAATPEFDRTKVIPAEAVADVILAVAAYPSVTLEDVMVPAAVTYTA